MSYLTLAQYQSITGLTPAGVNSVYINNKLVFWSSQIDEYTGTSFEDLAGQQTTVLSLRYGKQFKINVGAFQQFPQVSARTKGGADWIALVTDKDFTFLYPNFKTSVNFATVANPVTGLDFSCLSCRCACEQIRVVGENFWSASLPDDLKAILIELVDLLLAYDPRAYTSGVLPAKEMMRQVKSESDQTRRVDWARDAASIEKYLNKLQAGANSTDYAAIYNKYLRYSLNLTSRVL